jgi:hypothetical protein
MDAWNTFECGGGKRSIVASRRFLRIFGVGCTRPKPSGRFGRTLVPSHAGLLVTQRFSTSGVGEAWGVGEAVGIVEEARLR